MRLYIQNNLYWIKSNRKSNRKLVNQNWIELWNLFKKTAAINIINIIKIQNCVYYLMDIS